MKCQFDIRGKDASGRSRWFAIECDLSARDASTLRWMLNNGASVDLSTIVHSEGPGAGVIEAFINAWKEATNDPQ